MSGVKVSITVVLQYSEKACCKRRLGGALDAYSHRCINAVRIFISSGHWTPAATMTDSGIVYYWLNISSVMSIAKRALFCS